MIRTLDNRSTKYHLLRHTARSFFQALRDMIDANTFFVAINDGCTNQILSAWNKEETFISEGAALPLDLSYSQVVCSKRDAVLISDTSANPITEHLPFTHQWGACSFAGAPIILHDGTVAGTVCALDRKHVFSREHVKLLERMADFMSRLIELEEIIIYDELTGVYRRGYLELLFYNLPADSKKAVAFLDLDDFKQINDTYGHEAGDQVLRRVGSVLTDISSQHNALACRYAGDEFVLVFPAAGEDKVLLALEQLIEDISEPISVGDRELSVTASVGVCLEAASLQQYIQRADTAMYQIKRGTKHGMQVFAMSARDKTLEFSLRRAIEDKRFHLVYQPIVDAEDAKPVSIEALIRWETKEHGKIGPEHFLPFAEKIGLIQQIDLWVIREACAQLLTLPDWEQSGMKLNVNCSVKALREPEFADGALAILKEHGLPPERLVIELNQRTSLYDANLIQPQVRRMAESGVAFSLDDFGQGYSSLGMLKLLPIRSIKIDRMFVHNILNDPVSESIINGLVTIAEKLDLQLIAEGIETVEQHMKMKQLGCHQLQGHLFYEPMTFSGLRAVQLANEEKNEHEKNESHTRR